MRGLAALAKALNAGDYALALIDLAQVRFPPLPDKGASARMQKAAEMLERGASPAEVLKHFLSKGELAKFNPLSSRARRRRRAIHHGGDGHSEFRGREPARLRHQFERG
jgi:hypothetical protein